MFVCLIREKIRKRSSHIQTYTPVYILALSCNLSPKLCNTVKYSELVLGFLRPWFFPDLGFHVNPRVSILFTSFVFCGVKITVR